MRLLRSKRAALSDAVLPGAIAREEPKYAVRSGKRHLAHLHCQGRFGVELRLCRCGTRSEIGQRSL